MFGIQGLTVQLIAQLVATLVVVGGVVWFVSFYNSAIENKTVAKIERATGNAVSNGKRAAYRSVDRGVRGSRDPSTRDD